MLYQDEDDNLVCGKGERIYEIYSEGYRATGQESGYTFHGVSKGKSFIDAVKNFKGFSNPELLVIRKTTASYWGCKLFSTANAAKRSFG